KEPRLLHHFQVQRQPVHEQFTPRRAGSVPGGPGRGARPRHRRHGRERQLHMVLPPRKLHGHASVAPTRFRPKPESGHGWRFELKSREKSSYQSNRIQSVGSIRFRVSTAGTVSPRLMSAAYAACPIGLADGAGATSGGDAAAIRFFAGACGTTVPDRSTRTVSASRAVSGSMSARPGASEPEALASWTSKLPMSIVSLTMRGKPSPRWSHSGASVLSPASMAGLPGSSAMVLVSPPWAAS